MKHHNNMNQKTDKTQLEVRLLVPGVESVEDQSIRRFTEMQTNMKAHCERAVRTIKNEALDYFIVFGEGHLNHIVFSFVEFYNTLRPHQGVENVPLSGTVPEQQTSEVDSDEIVCREWLGGVLKHYERMAA